MRRATLSLLLATGAFLICLCGLTVSPAGAVGDPRVSAEFKLQTSDPLRAEVDNRGDQVNLSIFDRHRSVQYSVRGTVSPEGVEAQFGGLGRVQVAFHPTRTIETTAPPPACEGEPWTTRAGIFVGLIEFAGPHRYATIDQARAKGTMRVTPEWDCRGPRHPILVHGSTASKAGKDGDEATLSAFDGARRRFFVAAATRGPNHGSYTLLFGGTFRRQGAMRILSAAVIVARSPTFVFDHARGTAAVSPPWPFSGSASFRREPGGSTSWTGSLRVGLLDRPGTVALTGPGFRARLVRDFPGD